MSDVECIYPYRNECSCVRYGLNKALCGLYKTSVYISSLDFSMKNLKEVVGILRQIKEYPNRLSDFQWHPYFPVFTSYCEKISEGNSLLSLGLDMIRDNYEKSSMASKGSKVFEKTKRTIDKITPEMKDNLREVDKIDGVVIQS